MKRFILLLVLSIIYATSIFAQQKFFCEIKGAEKELSSGLKIVFVSIISWLSVLYALNGRKVAMWILFRYEKVIFNVFNF